MDRTVSFSYFYGEESEQFSYYRIPRLFITGSQFKNLSTDAKLLYGLLLGRMGLSAKTAGMMNKSGCTSTTKQFPFLWRFYVQNSHGYLSAEILRL